MREVHPHLRVMYMSGYTDDAIVHHGVFGPDTQFLSKPFVPSELRSRVRAILDGPGRKGKAAKPVGEATAPATAKGTNDA
jgi:DNA-binding response OmpR family regulator